MDGSGRCCNVLPIRTCADGKSEGPELMMNPGILLLRQRDDLRPARLRRDVVKLDSEPVTAVPSCRKGQRERESKR